MRSPRVNKILKEQAELLSTLHLSGVKPNILKRKLRVGKMYRNKSHTCNHQGGYGKAARRWPGWSKHGKKQQNVSH